MSNDDQIVIPKQGWLKIKLQSQGKWHRRYCIIDWDKAALFISSKIDGRYRDWIKLLPNILISDCESQHDNVIEIKVDNETHLLQTESKKEYECWFLALRRTAYSRIGGGIFGQTLEDTYKYSPDKVSLVPLIVRQCCEYLLEYGCTFVGLFRIPGKQSSIRELRDMYDRGLQINLDSSYSPATISSLLKVYLQSLPEPIIPIKNFDEFFEIGSRIKYNQINELDNLKQLIERTLSSANYALLAYLCVFLKKLTEYVHETKMDTDNLAVTFGHNLIRTTEELDLNMIKGHSYNLLPLIKAFIDHSEYLFPSQTNEPSEQNNESITKSSGFSSFSSLLSSNEQPQKGPSRSSSMPSISCVRLSSMDSSNTSCTGQSNNNDTSQDSSKSFLGSKTCDAPDQLNTQQSFVTCFEKDFSINQETPEINQIATPRKRCSSTNLKSAEQKAKHQSVALSEYSGRSDQCSDLTITSKLFSPATKTPKKTLANRFGKSLSYFKSNMTKAFQPTYSSTETLQQSNAIEISSPRPVSQNCEYSILDPNLSTDCVKSLQNESRLLRDLIDKKETVLTNLTKTSYEERLKYEREISQLKQTVEQLQKENAQLKALFH